MPLRLTLLQLGDALRDGRRREVVVSAGTASASESAGVMPNPLEELTIQQLRARTSMKWRAHPADVLPLWVAEMDVTLAPTVAGAVRRAIDIGDTGYPYGTGFAEAVSEFASQRWQWHDLEVGRTAIVPDVMLGVVEMLRLVTERGDTVIVDSPVYPRSTPSSHTTAAG